MTPDATPSRPPYESTALRARLAADFGLWIHDPVLVEGGLDSSAVVLRGVDLDGAAYAVKLRRDARPASLAVQRLLAEHMTSGVPRPMLAGSGEPWSTADGDHQLSVVQWISGRRAIEVGMGLEQWRAFGELLAQVHETVVPPDLTAVLPHEDFGSQATGEARRVGALVDEIGASTTSSDKIVIELREEWITSAGSIATLIEQLVELSAVLGQRSFPTVLCHADAHTANVIVDEHGRVWLLDWDEAAIAPRERDLMFVVDGVITDARVSAKEQAAFFQGYGEAKVDQTLLAYYRCRWALQDVVAFADEILDLQVPQATRARALLLFRAIFQPTGIVPLALAPVESPR